MDVTAGHCVIDQHHSTTRQHRNTTNPKPETAQTGSDVTSDARDDDALTTIIGRRTDDDDDDDDVDMTSRMTSCRRQRDVDYRRWSACSRSVSVNELSAINYTLNQQCDSVDRLSDLACSCRVPGTRHWRSLRHLLVLASSVMCWLTCFTSLQSLQSSLNARRSLGVASLATLYAVAGVSCFYSPPIIRRLSAKWTIVLAYVAQLAFVAANFDATGCLLVPGAAAAGALTGPLWSAQSTYLTTLAMHGDSSGHGQSSAAVIARFNGLFTAVMQTSQVWGNLVSSLVLSAHNETVHLFTTHDDVITRLTGNDSTARCAER